MAKENQVLFDSNLSMDEVHEKLEKMGCETRSKGSKAFRVKHDNARFVVSQEKNGYKASVKIPGYAFFIIWFLVSVLLIMLNTDMSAITSQNLSYATGSAIGTGLVPAAILYWIFAEIYNSLKKKDLKRFYEKAKNV